MATLDRIRRAFVAVGQMIAGAGASAVLGFIVQIALGRHFGPEFFGQFVICLTVATVFMPLVAGGLHWFESDPRVVADKSQFAVPISCWFRFGLSVGLIATATLALWITKSWLIAFVACTFVVATAGVERALGKLQIDRRFRAVGLLQPAVYIARLAAVLIGIAFASETTVWWILALTHGAIIIFLFQRFSFFEGIGVKACSFSSLSVAARELLPLMGIALVYVGTTQADKLVLSIFAEPATVGLYGVAASFLMLADLLPSIPAFRYLLPMLTRSVDHWSRQSQVRLIIGLVVGGAVSGAAVALLLALIATPMITSFFGDGFAQSATLLSLLAWALPGRFARILIEPYFLRGKLKRTSLIVNSIFLVAMLITMSGAFGTYGVWGIIWCRILFEAGCAIVMTTVLLNRINDAHPLTKRQAEMPN